MHITIPALQKRPKVLPMSLSEMLCTGTQSSGGQAVRMSVYASIMNASTTFCSPNATLRLPANSASTCGGSWAIIASNHVLQSLKRAVMTARVTTHIQTPREQEFVLTIIGDPFCLANTRRFARDNRCALARLCAPPLQLLRPRLEFDGERFGVIGNGGGRRAERDKGCPKDGDPAASTKWSSGSKSCPSGALRQVSVSEAP